MDKIYVGKLNKNIRSKDFIRFILVKYYGFNDENIIIEKTKNGKPFLKNSDLFYSVSHKNNYIVAIVSNKNYGIDLEIIKNKVYDYEKLSKKFFQKSEYEYITKGGFYLEKEIRFLKIWTKKEAYIKKKNLNLSYISKINVLNKNILTFTLDDLIISIA